MALATCPSCGEPGATGRSCGRCGASLLVDLVRAGPPAEGKVLFAAARALSDLGPPAPAFGRARELLASRSGVLGEQVSRSFATAAVELLGEAGVAAMTRPARVSPSAEASSLERPRAGFVMAAAVCVASLALALLYRARVPPGDRAAAAPRAVQVVSPQPRAVVVTPPAALSTEQIARAALPSVVAIHCKEKLGSGFFAAENVVVTNAHVACPEGEIARIRLHDGRQLLGRTIFRDDYTDYARMEVEGANVPALRIADPTSIEPGAPLVFIGSPKGLEFTVHEGKLSYSGRNIFGIGYLQLDASVNPGNSGGPLFDRSGAVVGIVTLKLADADGIGLALPISYAQAPKEPEALSRWGGFLAKVKAEDQRELDDLLGHSQKGRLVDVVLLRGQGLGAVLLQSGLQAPQAGSVRVALEQDGKVLCAGAVEIGRWSSMEERAKSGQEKSRVVDWLLRAGAAGKLFVGTGMVGLRDCPASVAGEAKARLVLRDGDEERGSVTLAGPELAEVSAEQPRAQPVAAQGSRVEDQEAASERTWRQAFSGAHAQVEAARARLEGVRGELERGLGSPYEAQLRARVAQAEDGLRAAEEGLRVLDRRASNAAVPQHWRR